MKFLDKLGLAVFSAIVLILSILLCLVLLGMQNGVYITIGISVVLILLAIKCLFFPSWEKHSSSSDDDGIMLQNDNGKLLITAGTIKNLVTNTIDEFKELQGSEVSVNIDDNNEVYVNIEINVTKETVIKEVSTKLQNKIKESVKKATDLEIKEINIKVNDVEKETQKRTEEKVKEAKEKVAEE